MTKNELMELSRECGLEFCEEECAQSVLVSLAQFANAILERAAVVAYDSWSELDAADRIRSLKLPTN